MVFALDNAATVINLWKFSFYYSQDYFSSIYNTPCPGKNGPPKQNAVKCTVYNTIQ